jgi:hypothetical protein
VIRVTVGVTRQGNLARTCKRGRLQDKERLLLTGAMGVQIPPTLPAFVRPPPLAATFIRATAPVLSIFMLKISTRLIKLTIQGCGYAAQIYVWRYVPLTPLTGAG